MELKQAFEIIAAQIGKDARRPEDREMGMAAVAVLETVVNHLGTIAHSLERIATKYASS